MLKLNAMPYALDVQTVQASAFRILVEALKEILTDANFEFDSTGMKIVAMDSSHTVLVHLRLNSENFETYVCTKNKLILGINLINFYKLMKIMGNNDTLSLRVDEDDLSSATESGNSGDRIACEVIGIAMPTGL